MLDNLGLGELFGLALLALMFFGPEQLPAIGARLGRWIRGLTQYSSAFLNEWRDEALVVQDAVLEVKGIRDEIVAAQAEIVGTLDAARAEMDGAVLGATQEVEQPFGRPQDAPQQIEAAGKMPALQLAPPPQDTEAAGNMPVLEMTDKKDPLPSPPPLLPTGEGTRLRSPSPELRTLRSQVDALRTEVHDLRAALAQVRTRIEAQSAIEREADPAVVSPEVEYVGEASP